jgi:hypothetical protein
MTDRLLGDAEPGLALDQLMNTDDCNVVFVVFGDVFERVHGNALPNAAESADENSENANDYDDVNEDSNEGDNCSFL